MLRCSFLPLAASPFLVVALAFCGAQTSNGSSPDEGGSSKRDAGEDASHESGSKEPDSGSNRDGDARLDVPDGSFACGSKLCKAGKELCVAVTDCTESDSGRGIVGSDGGVTCVDMPDACSGCDCLWPAATGTRCLGGPTETVTSCEGDAASGVTLACQSACGV
jgi:hypothetical protein